MALSGNTVIVRASSRLRRIDLATRQVTTFSGRASGGDGYWDGPATASSLETFGDVTPAANGAFLFPDVGNKIRHADATGYVRTIAKSVGSVAIRRDRRDRAAAVQPRDRQRQLQKWRSPRPSGNLIVAEKLAKLVRRIDTAGAVTPIAGLYDSEEGASRAATAPAAKPHSAARGRPRGRRRGRDLGDRRSCLRRIDTANAVTTPAGNCEAAGTTDGPGASALFYAMDDVALGSGGNVFVSQNFSQDDPPDRPAGVVSDLCGCGAAVGHGRRPIATARFSRRRAWRSHPTARSTSSTTSACGGSRPTGRASRPSPRRATQVRRLVVDPAGTIYYLTMASDPYMLPAGAGGARRWVPGGGVVVLGAAPAARLAIASKLALVAPKTLVVLCYQQLVVVNLPWLPGAGGQSGRSVALANEQQGHERAGRPAALRSLRATAGTARSALPKADRDA